MIDQVCVMVAVLDTGGSEEYRTMWDSDISLGQGFVLVFSVTSRSTFQQISFFREHILRVKEKERVPMVLAGNKVDLENEREVSKIEGSELAQTFAIPFFETSAKFRKNVEETFFEAVRQIQQEESLHQKKERKKISVCRLI